MLLRTFRIVMFLGALLVLTQMLVVLTRLSSSSHAHDASSSSRFNDKHDENLNHLTAVTTKTTSSIHNGASLTGASEQREQDALSASNNSTTIIQERIRPLQNITETTATTPERPRLLENGDSWQPQQSKLLYPPCFMVNNDTAISQHFSSSDDAPQWVRCYLSWHREMRRRFPGQSLLTHPNAPGLLIKYCDGASRRGLCGGLHDRLGSLASWVYLANQTQRVLLYKWYRPLPLETFLQPNLIDWTVPHNDTLFSKQNIRSKRHHRAVMYKWQKTRQRYKDDLAKRLNSQDENIFGNKRILTASADATVQRLPQFLRALGETDMMDGTTTRTFGEIFLAFFRPSDRLQSRLDSTMTALGLQQEGDNDYVAAHSRVRHPARYDTWRLVGKDNNTDADESGLPWAAPSLERDAAIQSALHAIQCSRLLLLPSSNDDSSNSNTTSNITVYFYSDSEDLVRLVTNQTSSTNITTADIKNSPQNTTINNSSSIPLSLEVWRERAETVRQQGGRIVSRPVDRPTAHLDRGERYLKGLNANAVIDAYMDTFLDLYIAISARCVSYGFGNYAYFAAKISGTKCLQRHEQPSSWVGRMWNQQSHGAMCPIPV